MSDSTSSPRRYLSVAETAKLVRKALRADFPGVKFSVRSSSYAGGASIDVGWTDGPTEKSVRAKTLSLYSGGSFDGMTDMMSYHDSLLMGENGPEVVSFGADFVHGQRRVSDVRIKVYRRELSRFIGETLGPNDHSRRVPVSCGHYGDERGELARDEHRGEYVSTILSQMAHARPWSGARCPGSDTVYCDGCGRWQEGHEREPHLR